jgi:hypothetical protein
MSGYVIIGLDTTKPEIEIYAPKYTTKEITNTITIKSNEALADYQEIYVIDSYGDRYDYTFEKESNSEFVGLIKFSNLPIGVVTIYARMKDDVDNYSDTVSLPINLKESLSLLKVDIRDYNKDLNVLDTYRNIEVNNGYMDVNIKDFDRYEEDEVR